MENFSVLISVYEKENPEYLKTALNSVIKQTLKPSQIVLIQDGILPESLVNLIDSFSREHSKLFNIICLNKNHGLGCALRVGLKSCENEIVARMDTDDICYIDRFEKQVAYLIQNPNISALGSGVQEFNKTPGDLNQFKRPPLGFPELKAFAKFRNPLNHPSVVFRKSHVILAGSYKDMPLFEDYYLWARMISMGYQLANIQEPLLHFRTGNDMIGRRHGVGYLKKELSFLKAINHINFINRAEFCLSILIKLPLRLLPKSLLKLIYEVFLR